MKRWAAVEWLLLGCAAIALGLGVAWAEGAYAIPRYFVSVFFLALFLVAAGFAVWAGWGYYRVNRDEDDWD